MIAYLMTRRGRWVFTYLLTALFCVLTFARPQSQSAHASPHAAPPATVSCVTVSWQDAANVTVSGNTLTKINSNAWDGGARSVEYATSGLTYVEWTVSQTFHNRMFGLNWNDTNHSYTDIAYAFHDQGDDNQLNTWHFGSLTGLNIGNNPGIGAVLKVEIDDAAGTVKYYENGAVRQTFTGQSFTWPIFVDTSLHEIGSVLENVVLCSGSLAGLPTDTPTNTPTYTPTNTPTDTPTNTPTPTPTNTATNTPVPTVTCATASHWCTSISPNGNQDPNILHGVVALADNDIWAVGGDGVSQGGSPLTEHWDGQNWSIVPVPPSLSGIGILNAVAGIRSTRVWAASASNIIYWNGTTWVLSLTDESISTGANSITVVSDNNAWAVGQNIKHWTGGSQWVSAAIPSPGGILNGVAAVNASDIWAVGYTGTSPNRTQLLVHYNGSAWSTWTAPLLPPGSSDAILTSVDLYGSTVVWAVGSYAGSDGHRHTLTEYYRYENTGNDWRVIPSPDGAPISEANQLQDVWVTKEGSVWAVGSYVEDPKIQTFKPLILHWNSQAWDVIESARPGIGGQLLSVTGSASTNDPGNIITSDWAVGSYVREDGTEGTLIEHFSPPGPAPIRTTSYYETSTSPTIHKQQGCAAATPGPNNNPSGLVILDYGQPRD